MQQSGRSKIEFGGECMLGKLCRLEKQCRRRLPAVTRTVATLARTMRRPET
jgi:hypothetical protein